MAQPATGPIDVALALFSGLCTEINAPDLPEGVSPDNQDVIYLPGSTAARPGTHKIFGTPFPGNPLVNYCKSYIQPNGNPVNLYLDANGIIYLEDVVNTPGIYTTLANVIAGSSCMSVTASGKEYFAFNDGLKGVDIPRQYDGTNFDRVSQDGPGAAPTSVTEISSQANISSIVLSNIASITAISEVGNVVTVTTAAPHGLTALGGFVLIYGVVTVVGYNGGYQILTIPSATTFTTTNAGTGLAADTTGTVGLGTVTVTTSTPHGLNVGDAAFISGAGGTLNNNQNQTSNIPTPPFWDVVEVVSTTVFRFSLLALHGQGTFNSTTITGSGASGTVQVGGMISLGTHQVAVSFVTRQGYFTKPSPPISFTCTGNKQATLAGIPIGPANVVARLIVMTLAGGSNFFTLQTNAMIAGNSLLFNGGLAPATIVKALLIPDNTTTTFTLDIPDNVLTPDPVDQPGNNLFAQVVLAPCLGVESFADRLWWSGEFNKVQRFLNMGFEGGIRSGSPNGPLGWTLGDAQGALISSPVDFGLAWQITGVDGSATRRGEISQSAYQDYLFNPILQPNTAYTFYCWAKAQSAAQAGNIVAEFFSASSGSLATATIPLSTVPSAAGKFVNANFSAKTPASIPSDTVFRVYATNLVAGQTCVIDEMMAVFTAQPFKSTQFRVSYPSLGGTNSLESYDGNTGTLGPVSDPSPIRGTAIIRETMCILTAERLHSTRDNGSTEPDLWDVPQIEDKVGAASSRGIASGNGWFVWVSVNDSDLSLRVYGGGDSSSIAQEVQTIFSSINQDAMTNIWAVNDSGGSAKRIYLGLPTGAATTPNLLVPLDYRSLHTSTDLANNGPIHISFTGKMIASDLCRKWSRWNLALNCGAILYRSKLSKKFVAGAGAAFGNLYFFDPAKLTDDDFGKKSPYYTTYFFINHEMEQALPTGARRKLYDGMTIFISGVGYLQVTPLINSLANAGRPMVPLDANGNPLITLQANPQHDLEVSGFAEGERVAFKVAVTPLIGTTDVDFNLQHMSVRLQKHPTSPMRGKN